MAMERRQSTARQMGYSLRILHISDFHDRGTADKAAWRRRRVLGDAWVDNLNFLKAEGPQFDFVFFTGDVAFSGKAAELESASEFIEATLSVLGVEPSRLLLVPGNHDVDRSISAAEWATFRSFWNHENDASMSNWLAGGGPPPGADPGWIDAIMKRSHAYREWVETKLKRPDLLPKNSPHGRLGYRASFSLSGIPFPIHIVGLDSAWLAGDPNDARKLRISDDQAMRLSTAASGDRLDGLKLGLIHHPLGELADGEHCRTLLADKLDLLLRGHLHSAETVTVSDPDRALTELAAGCLYEHDRYPNGCTALTLDLNDQGNIQGMEVHLRAWSSNGFWFDDGSRYRNSQSGKVRLVASNTQGRKSFAYATGATTPRGENSFDRLEERLRARTHDDLVSADGRTRLKLARVGTREGLAKTAEVAIPNADVVIVSGQPGVGKSAVVLSVVSELRERGLQVVCLSLRDLPSETAQLDGAFGRPLEETFRAASKRGRSVFVLDGAEALLEGREAVFEAVFSAAVREQYAVLLIVRDDVHEPLRARCVDVLRGSRELRDHHVDGLDPGEIRQIVETFPLLKGLESAPGAQWLLARPGWIGLLLRASSATIAPADAISEAQVYSTVWQGLVRRNELVGTDRATPEAREAALLTLARRDLLRTPPGASDPYALTSLRRDGLLLPFEPFASGDEFAHDLIRDLAIARLLITSSLDLLIDAKAPRWALHAARLALQARLLRAADLAAEAQFQLTFSRRLTESYGERWLDLAIEALVGLEGSISINSAWSAFAADHGSALERLTQWLWLHRCKNTVADVSATSPFVEMICANADSLESLADDLDDSGLIDAVLLAWLRGLASRLEKDTSHPLRQRLREQFLRVQSADASEWTLEAIGLLGPDLDAPAEVVMRECVQQRPDGFAEVVEGVAAHSLAVHRIDLLFFLVEAYYIDDRYIDNHSDYDYGIRSHAPGAATPLAAWYYGPFLPLLRRQFQRACRLINKLLNHAARARASELERLSDVEKRETSVSIEAPFVGRKTFIGDQHTWRWYRATGVGPYPCMSALMALERVIDEVFQQVPDLPLSRIVARLIDGAESLAMAGFIVGTLIRHLERVNDDFDTWLINEPVWQLETARAVTESTSFIGVSAESTEAQKERRRWPPRELVQRLVAKAVLEKNTQRIEAFQRVGERLVKTAAASRNGGDVGSIVRNYASVLDARNYKPVPGAEGYMVQYEPPPELVAELAPAQLELARTQAGWHLVFKYRPEATEPFDEQSANDLLLAKELEKNPPERGGTIDLLEGAILFASRAVLAHLRGKFALAEQDWEWATDLLIRNASTRSDTIFEDSISPTGIDRSVAAALPSLYAEFWRREPRAKRATPRSKRASLRECVSGRRKKPRVPSKAQSLLTAIGALAARESAEVRRVLAAAIADVWNVPCAEGLECFHRELFTTVRTAAARCVYGAFEGAQWRPTVVDVTEPLEKTLPAVDPESLALDWLTASITAVGACASSGCCMAGQATALRATLLDAHARAMSLRERGQWGPPHIDHRPVAAVLLEAGSQSIISYMQALGESAAPIGWLLQNIAAVAAERTALRQTLREAWPVLFDRVVGLADRLKAERYWGESALAALVPALVRPSDDWVNVETLGTRLEQWARAAANLPNCIDAVAVALQNAPMPFQLTRGLAVVRGMMDDFTDIARRTSRLIAWLSQLETNFTWATSPNADFVAIVDGLVAAGDVRFLKLQQKLDERMSRRR